MRARLALAVLLPWLALALQWALWPWISPFVWFLFFPAVFFSARLGGLWGGLASTVLSAGLVWYFFIPPQLSWKIAHPANLYSVGMFLGMGCLFSDAWERLRRAQRRSEAALAETRAANAKITELYHKTLELDKLKSQFFANVSHELRTPLTLILSPLARRLAAGGLPQAQRREDEMMLRNARMLYRQVSDLLDAAKLEAGRMAVAYARLDLGALVRATASHFDSLAQEKGIAYRVDVSAPLEVEADGEKLQRIVINLLSNAFKFTPAGGRVAVRLREEAGRALIEVRDNGPGVPAALRAAVFERFRQLEGGSQRRFGGTGLGLAIVKEFAELHGGSVAVDEAEGGGALFAVRLPLQAPAGTAIGAAASRIDPVIDRQAVDELRPPPREAAAPAGVADAPRVLVVEDNADMNAFIAATLRPHYRVACAFDGREGLEMALALQPDLILSDVMMPGLSGEDMVLALRRLPGLADLPVVMLTARADEAMRVRLLQEGVQDYLSKPFSVEELLARVGGLVSGHRRARAELHRYEQIVATSGDMLAFIDTERRFQVVNPAYAGLFDTTPAQLRQQPVAEIVGPANYAFIGPRLDGALAGEIQRFVFGPAFPDGRRRVLDAEYRPFRQDGEVRGVVVSLRDITERRAMEQLVRDHEQRHRFALDTLEVGEWELNLATRTAIRSLLHARIFGYDSLSPAWNYELFIEHVMPEDRARVGGMIRQAIDGGTVLDFECQIRRADGQARWIHARAQPRSNDAGEALLTGIVMDITERKQAEAEILRLNAGLEKRVGERTAELLAANRELDSFAYAVSHDLRAPLRAMSGFSQALAEDYGGQLQGEGKLYLEQIDLASRKMGDLIDGLLALSRSTRGELRRDDVDISTLARQLLAELARSDPGRRVDTQIEDGLRVRGDLRMIEVVMRNLLGNAWKYTLHAASASIRVYADEPAGARRICVADNGAGFDMAHGGRLFQPFQRLHRQDEFPGIGIGLATVQRIVQRHGGAIEARGELGKGAVFCFTLPDLSTRKEAL